MENQVKEFWEKWHRANSDIHRLKGIEELPVFKEAKGRPFFTATLLNSYLEDLDNFLFEKYYGEWGEQKLIEDNSPSKGTYFRKSTEVE